MPDTGDPRPTDRRSVAVFDIDGVLADVRHRLHHVAARPKNWAAFFSAAPLDRALPEGLAAVRAAHQAGHLIVYLTGRPERCRVDTRAWLTAHGLPDGELVMRQNSDRRPARVTKVLALRRLDRCHRVAAFVDDDAAVVDAVRRAGFPVLHARWMGSATSGADGAPDLPDAGTSQDVLFEIQESEGRT